LNGARQGIIISTLPHQLKFASPQKIYERILHVLALEQNEQQPTKVDEKS